MSKRVKGRGSSTRSRKPANVVKGLLRYFRMRFFSDLEPFGCSLAPTSRCNLKCAHCYERPNRNTAKGKGLKELDLDQMRAIVDDLSRRGVRHCTITDGEPLIDRRSLDKVEAILDGFWVNYLVTNGTFEFPDYKVMYIVSLDGPPKVHDSLRGQGVFSKMKRNIGSSPNDLIYALCTINTINREHIEDTVRTAQELGLRGIMFNWKNPVRKNDATWVPYLERNLDIDEVLGSKDGYGDFICNTNIELEHLRTPDWGKICPHEFVISIDAYGNRKEPCIFGRYADCTRCGCHVFPALMEAVQNGRPSIEFRLILDFMSEYWFKLSTDKMMRLIKAQSSRSGKVKESSQKVLKYR